MKLRPLSSTIAAIAALSGCGGGGGANEPTQQVDTPPYVAPTPRDPQGFWQGTTVSGRTVSGVVTKEGDYWFAYTAIGNSQIVEGFYAGLGAISPTTAPNGRFTSSNLRDLNFIAHSALAGAIAVPAGSTDNYVAKNTLAASLEPVSIDSATYSISGAFPVTATIFGSPLTVPFTVQSGTYNSATGAGSWTVSGDVSGMGFGVITFDQTFTLDATSGLGNLGIGTNCVGNGIACGGVGPNFNGPINAGGPIVAGVQTWVVTTPQFGSPTFAPLLTQNLLPTITTDGINLTYDSAYETEADLTALNGHYTGTAGIGTAQSSPAATLSVDTTVNPAAISGDATIGIDACHYTGTISEHATGGNVYDVTLTVTNCPQAAGNFAGVAQYDGTNKKITVMAMTASTSRDSGVLFVGTKP